MAEKMTQDHIRARLQEEQYPTRHPVHKCFLLISCLTVLAALSMGLGQVLGISFQMVGPIQYVMRLYVIALCLLVIMAELEWTTFARDSLILNVWITRGLIYAFIGTLGLEENDRSAQTYSDHRFFTFMQLYVKLVAWMMIGFGALYFFMGIFCLQIVYKRIRNDYQERLLRAAGVRRTVDTYGTGYGNV